MAYLWFGLFVASVITNAILIWYVRKLIKQFADAIENAIGFQEFIDEYEAHLEVVLQMEAFSGEPTIENLLKHTKDMSAKLKEIGNPFSIQQEGE